MYENNSNGNNTIKQSPKNKQDPRTQNFIDQKNPMNVNRRRNSIDSRMDNKNQVNNLNNINNNIHVIHQPISQIDVKSIITQVERPSSKTTNAKNKEVIK